MIRLKTTNFAYHHEENTITGKGCLVLRKKKEKTETPVIKEILPYTKETFLSEVYLAEEQYQALIMVLKRKQNIILQGAPGVGKTFLAKRLAYAMMGKQEESHIAFVQFHQNYSYEDFVMGYRPNAEGFTLKYGIFYEFCKIVIVH